MGMNKNQDKYPNKEDYEPRVPTQSGYVKTDELPLSDPSDSNTSDAFRKNQGSKTGINKPSAFNENKKEIHVKKTMLTADLIECEADTGPYMFNKEIHKKWNDLNPKVSLVRD